MFNYNLDNCEICTNVHRYKTLNPYHCLQCQQHYKFEGQSSLANMFKYTDLREKIAVIGIIFFFLVKYFGNNLTVMALLKYLSTQASIAFYFLYTHFPKNTNVESKPLKITEAEFQTFLKKTKRDDLIFITIFVIFHIMAGYVAYIQKLSLFAFLSLPMLGIFLFFPLKSFMEMKKIQKSY